MKRLLIILAIALTANITACSQKKVDDNESGNNKVVEEQSEDNEVVDDLVGTTPVKNEVDYSDSFNGIQGCAVFYNPTDKVYDFYNSELCEEEIPPYSSFKIINTLLGLSQNVVTSADSKLGYDGTIYWREQWNKDITLKEAFKESCVWYYEKIMDSLDKEYVQQVLNDLQYGNCDITAWDESGHNVFWISSSLKISPIQQVEVLSNIFEGKTSFNSSHVELLKDFMLVDSNENYSIYGKTGSASKRNAWFTGFFEKDNERTYFAVRLDDETQELAGSVAKSIALDIISKQYNSN